MKDLVIIGAGGHSKDIADVALKSGYNLLGFLDDNLNTKSIFDYPILSSIHEYLIRSSSHINFFIGIGNNLIRKELANKYSHLNFITLIHPSVKIAQNVEIGKGTVIGANSVINSSVRIGEHSIVNANAVISHDCQIGNYSHIAPGAILCGTVFIGDLTHIGAGTVVRNNIDICSNVTVGIGSVIVKDINVEGTYFGVPVVKH